MATRDVNALAWSDDDRARALLQVLVSSEQELRIKPDYAAGFVPRVDAVLRKALAGGLDQRRYAVMFTVRKHRLDQDAAGKGFMV
jgi:hypothetical protein